MVRKKKNQGAVWISTGLTHKGFIESATHGQPNGCHPVPVLFRNTHAANTNDSSKIQTGLLFYIFTPEKVYTSLQLSGFFAGFDGK